MNLFEEFEKLRQTSRKPSIKLKEDKEQQIKQLDVLDGILARFIGNVEASPDTRAKNCRILISNVKPGNGTINRIKQACREGGLTYAELIPDKNDENERDQLRRLIKQLNSNTVLAIPNIDQLDYNDLALIVSLLDKADCPAIATCATSSGLDGAVRTRFGEYDASKQS